MEHAQQKRWLTDLLESVPSIVFILIWRQSGDIETAGWVGAAAAFGVLGVLSFLKTPMHPVLMGVNLHILLTTPLIVGLFRAGQTQIAEFMAAHAYGGVLVTVFVVGTVLTAATRRGFSSLSDVPPKTQRRYSVIMLGLCACGAAWAFATSNSRFVPVVVTLTVLIVGRNFLQARMSDTNGSKAGLAAGGLAGGPGGSSETA